MLAERDQQVLNRLAAKLEDRQRAVKEKAEVELAAREAHLEQQRDVYRRICRQQALQNDLQASEGGETCLTCESVECQHVLCLEMATPLA